MLLCQKPASEHSSAFGSALRAVYEVIHLGGVGSVPSLQTCSGAGLHAAAGPTALGIQWDSEGGFQPQNVGDARSVLAAE